MSTTLIVRDATLAINGAPEKRDEPRQHLRKRVAEVAHMDARTAQECVEVLSSVADGDGADPDVLEALVIVAVALPKLAERLDLPTVTTGRRLAQRLERDSELDRTLAVLELLQQHFPGQEALERDLAQLMRRQGTVQDLAQRYFERAQKFLREGRTSEAAGWLREVLQLDPTRKDAARLIRDLRFKRTTHKQRRSGGYGGTLAIAAAAVVLAWGALREVRLEAEFRGLPPAAAGNPLALKRRLADLEQFIAHHPIWHGALRALAERSELRVQVEVLDEKAQAEKEAAERARNERLESADLCREQGLMRIQSGDRRGALEAFRKALEFGGAEWRDFQRTQRDVSDLEASLKDQP